MGIKLPGTGIRKRLVITFLLISSCLYAFDLQVLPETLISGRVITLKVSTEIPETEELFVDEVILPDELQLISGPVIRPYYARVDGVNKRFHQVTWALRSKDSGVFTIPSFNITVKRDIYTIDVPVIKVFKDDEKFNNYPLMVSWNKDIKKEIFVGQSLPIIVEAYNLEEINFPDRIVSTNPRRGEIVEVSGLGDINPEKVGGADLYRVPVASWIYTPFEAGVVSIPRVRVDINGLTRYTDTLEINVLPLKVVNATGGVGEFLITTELTESQVTPEDLFHYKVKISGQGNIPYIKFPALEYSGLILIEKNETEDISYSNKGYLGWREIDYTFQAIESGVKEISISDVSWIDTNGNDVFYKGNIRHINVVSSKEVEEVYFPFLTLMNTAEIISSYKIALYKIPYMWLLFGLSTFLYIVFKITKVFKSNKERRTLLISVALIPLILTSGIMAKGFEYQGDLSSADSYIEAGEFESALSIYDTLSSKLPNNYGLFVNQAIIWDKLDNISRAVYNIRVAERIYPNNKKIQSIKSYLSESEESSQKQAKTANPINSDYIFILLIIFFNLLTIILIRLIKVRNITIFSLLFTSILFSILSTITLAFIDIKNNVPAGIIQIGGVELTKVPNPKALKWMNLAEGNCVYIKGEWNDQYLIETEYGLQGWVSKFSILVLKES